MIYVDKLRKAKWKFRQSCHLFSNDMTSIALHRMAKSIGLARRYFQNSDNFPHYDLTRRKREMAVLVGATEVSNRFAVRVRALRKEQE